LEKGRLVLLGELQKGMCWRCQQVKVKIAEGPLRLSRHNFAKTKQSSSGIATSPKRGRSFGELTVGGWCCQQVKIKVKVKGRAGAQRSQGEVLAKPAVEREEGETR
jgi:hypothetical protein